MQIDTLPSGLRIFSLKRRRDLRRAYVKWKGKYVQFQNRSRWFNTLQKREGSGVGEGRRKIRMYERWKEIKRKSCGGGGGTKEGGGICKETRRDGMQKNEWVKDEVKKKPKK
jgi:hypothetical protein